MKGKIKVSALDKLLGREAPDYVETVDPAAIDALAADIAAEAVADAPPPKVEHVESADEKWLRGIKQARSQLAEFRLSPLSLTLLARACDNVASNMGNGIEDLDVRGVIQQRAALFAAANNDLIDVLAVIKEAVPMESMPGMVYSTCFAVQKAANFAANLMYRRALDARDGEAEPLTREQRSQAVRTEYGAFAADQREEHREAPAGLGPDPEQPLNFGNVTEHPDTAESGHVAVLLAYQDLHLYLQLLTEMHGHDISDPMPYMFEQNRDGSFSSVWGAEQALDLMEVRSAQSRVKRTAKRSANLALALAGAADVLKRAGRRTAAA